MIIKQGSCNPFHESHMKTPERMRHVWATLQDKYTGLKRIKQMFYVDCGHGLWFFVDANTGQDRYNLQPRETVLEWEYAE